MTDKAISVSNLSKRYRIGLREEKQDTLAGSFGRVIQQPMVNLRQLRRLAVYGNNEEQAEDIIWALRDVSFDVRRGEVLGIIGRNGAGKSTLLKLLSRITYPTTGRIELHGRFSSLLEVGTGFHSELTGRENVYLNGTILGMRKSEIDRKFDEIVDFSGVEKFIDTPIKRYSSGMKVRLAFSVAAYLEPEILLIDEVLSVGDAEFQKKSMGKMEEISEYGRTVLFVSHNLPVVRNLCTRGIVLTDGMITYDGAVSEGVDHYLSTFESQENVENLFKSERVRSKVVDVQFVRIKNKDGEETPTYYSDEPIHIEIGYKVKTPIEDLLIKLQLNDREGHTFLGTVDMDYPPRVGFKIKEPGNYISRCTFPPNMFGTHTFYLDLLVTKWGTTPYYVDLRKIARFDTILVHSSSKNHGDQYGHAMRPDFTWQIIKVSEDAKND